ncbi:zinc finger protein 628-like [Sitodiplosis mosellana]|uniref:zinc finger protein 628-like n=1 Tax=Sitodiplosis mosellana TaxID=263140 RepID=UPI00244476E0|nr:zinc finger protein 628-like [Sitodiplosis mosellana]
MEEYDENTSELNQRAVFMCRICLTRTNISAIQCANTQVPLATKIRDVYGIDVADDDFICDTCHSWVDCFYESKQMCKKASTLIEQCLSTGKLPEKLEHPKISHELIESQKPFKCGVCNKSYAKEGYLINHLQTSHSFFKCKHCDRGFQTNGLLNVHYIEEHGIERHSCHHCNLTYASRRILTAHIDHSHKTHCPTVDESELNEQNDVQSFASDGFVPYCGEQSDVVSPDIVPASRITNARSNRRNIIDVNAGNGTVQSPINHTTDATATASAVDNAPDQIVITPSSDISTSKSITLDTPPPSPPPQLDCQVANLATNRTPTTSHIRSKLKTTKKKKTVVLVKISPDEIDPEIRKANPNCWFAKRKKN